MVAKNSIPANPNAPVVRLTKMLIQVAVGIFVPGGGAAAGWFMDGLVRDPGQAAVLRFIEQLAQKVEGLYDLPEVAAALEREESRALFSQALGVASRTYSPKKLEALKNATVNGVLHKPDNIDLTAIIFDVIERLTDGHLTMLQSFRQREMDQNPIPWRQLALVGVDLRETSDGLKKPVFVGVGDSKRFVEAGQLAANRIIAGELMSLGLITQMVGIKPPVSQWSEDASKNLPGTVEVTEKGLLLLEHIADLSAPA